MARLADMDAVEAEITALSDLGFAELKERFERLAGSPPPKRIGRRLLMLAVAYEIQRKAYSVRTDRLARQLEADASTPRPKLSNNVASRRSLRPGGRIVREWRGRAYEVYVADDGCYLDGKRFGSLSAVAEAITGVKRNGPAFFGLRSSRVSP